MAKDRSPDHASNKISKITGKGPGRKLDQNKPDTRKPKIAGRGRGEPEDPKGKYRKPR